MFTSSLEVAKAVWGVIFYAFPAFILYPRYPFLANSGQDTGLWYDSIWPKLCLGEVLPAEGLYA